MSAAGLSSVMWKYAGRRVPRSLPFILLMIAGLWVIGQAAIVPVKAQVAQVLLDRAFEQSVSTHAPVKAWPWADAAPIARIKVPRLNVTEIILSGGSGEAMAFGPTLMPGSATPGERGTAVLAAHRDTHFRFLKDIRPDDIVIVESIAGTRLVYRVLGGHVVRNDRFGIDRLARTSVIAMTTCWPFGSETRGPWRYAVIARRIN